MPQLFSKLSMRASTTLSDSIANDIVSLMNGAIRSARLRLSNGSLVAESVLNYGNPPLAVFGTSRIDPIRIAFHMRESLLLFEPRLDSSNLSVVHRPETDRGAAQTVYFDISAVSRADGAPLKFRLALDYLSGSFNLARAW
ncbi:GPW/gp25 family protein [Collimonas humicola]|uniref:GPW/gp25 family protein n=1 Tax=Collimonas humicola TaxID=2825886 RepID=UPI001B8CD85E|nr:GPW/gp25 family protein [Collimonas humicola]